MVYRGDPETAEMAAFHSAEEAHSWVKERMQPDCVLTVATMRGTTDLGNFLIFTNINDVAHVRLLEHQGFYARRTKAVSSSRSVAFTSDVGSTFTVDENSTIPAATALRALAHWLHTGQPDPSITWGEE